MTKFQKIKNRTFEIIQTAEKNDLASRVFDVGIIALILLNVALVIADTFTLPSSVTTAFGIVETVSVVIFSAEYLCRVWTADLLYPDRSPIRARVRYVFSFMAIIDLLAILPFYIPFLIPIDLRILRMLRIVRLFRVFKLNRYTSALSTIAAVFKKKKSQLLSSIFVVLLLMVIAAVLMYSIENEAQPEVFANAFSALWWAIATLTTVGYGDIYPVTVLGKVLSAVIALLGIGLVAVPTGIISAGFMETIDHDEPNGEEKKFCPYCGKKIK